MADDLCNKEVANGLCSMFRGGKHFWPLGEVIHKHNSILVAIKCLRKLQNIYPNTVKRTCHWDWMKWWFGSLHYVFDMLNISDMLCTISEFRTSFPATSIASSAGCLSWLHVGAQKIVLHQLPQTICSKVILGQLPLSNHLSGCGRVHHLWERTTGPLEQVSLMTCCLLVELLLSGIQ